MKGDNTEINLRKPLTTEQAQDQFQCNQCAAGEECDQAKIGIDCVESASCSFTCPHENCKERIWFSGSSWHKQIPDKFACPYCGGMLRKVNDYEWVVFNETYIPETNK